MNKLYCDLDGVLVDFVGGYKKLTGQSIETMEWIHGKDTAWEMIDNYGKFEFWYNLEPTEWGIWYWEQIKQYNPTILTNPGPNSEGVVESAKTYWVREHLGVNPVICVYDKQRYSDTNTMLIDDSYRNRTLWSERGGRAVKVYDRESAMESIKGIKEFIDVD
jgi:hypothetical protein